MNKHKLMFGLMSLSTLIVLSACQSSTEKEPIKPDVEPNAIESVKNTPELEGNGITMQEATTFFSEGKELEDYKELFKKAGYEKPFKELSLGYYDEDFKKGIIYEVEDGYSMIEYNESTNYVVAITGFQEEREIMLQEMKTKAFDLEIDVELEEDTSKKADLQKELDQMWEEIGVLENQDEA